MRHGGALAAREQLNLIARFDLAMGNSAPQRARLIASAFAFTRHVLNRQQQSAIGAFLQSRQLLEQLKQRRAVIPIGIERLGEVEALAGYRVYTTAFDRIVNAAALASRDELTMLRRSLDADFSLRRLERYLLLSLPAAAVTMLRVYCSWPGASAMMNLRCLVAK